MNLQEVKAGAKISKSLIKAIEDTDAEITDGAFICDKCREEYELEEDIIMFGLCGNCYTDGEVKTNDQ